MHSGRSSTLRSPHRLPSSKRFSTSAPPAATRIDATAAETKTVASRATPPTMRRVVVAEMASAERRLVQGEQRDGHRHLPQHLGVVP